MTRVTNLLAWLKVRRWTYGTYKDSHARKHRLTGKMQYHCVTEAGRKIRWYTFHPAEPKKFIPDPKNPNWLSKFLSRCYFWWLNL